MRSSTSRMYPSVTAAVSEVWGWRFRGCWRKRDLWQVTWALEARLVCTMLLYVSVRRDSTLKSNYTTITSSLIKLRATRLIQPCDPAERAHSSPHRSHIIQSVLQQRPANWWCCYVYGCVADRVWPLTYNYFLMFPTVCFLKWNTAKRFWTLWSLTLNQLAITQNFNFKMINLAFEKLTPATTH